MNSVDDGVKILAESWRGRGFDLSVVRARIDRAGPSKDVDADTYHEKACVTYRVYRPCFGAYDEAEYVSIVEHRIWRAARKIVGRDASIGRLGLFGEGSKIIWISPLPEDVGAAQSEAMHADIRQLTEWVRIINSRIEKIAETGLYLANHSATYGP